MQTTRSLPIRVALRRTMGPPRLSLLAALLLPGTGAPSLADPLHLTIAPPEPPHANGFDMGTARSPDGDSITVDNDSLLLNGKPWTPVMGEFHFSRYPASEWREELLKMKAGGVDNVATYVFWIHHEEVEGQFDWSGRRSLRRFVETVNDAGLKAIVRCGPWCHGEVRNGGLPDWILNKGWRTRSNDSNYLAQVEILYGEIAKQLDGLLWKDGGPVVGIQLENEFRGPAQHLLRLKQIARDVGLDVPLYTRTGWPALTSPMPFGEIIPLYGVYAEGFWDREITPMPGRYWAGFHFSTLRTDSNIANELLGRRAAKDESDVARYPYLTCEIGGGMMNSYHRRILIDPRDIESTTLVKLGSGSTSPGYYMYHGGVNPEGKLSTLQESQATGYWNDLPVKSYDFQAPLGQYGQIRPQYHLLRRLHLFLHEWGSSLARMPAVMPDQRPQGKTDFETLRWCARSDGRSGFVFVNNYQRLQPLPAKAHVEFSVDLPGGNLHFSEQPVTVPADQCFIWPFNLDLGYGVTLAWAAAQPVCAVNDGDTRTVFFAETPGVTAQFALRTDGKNVQVQSGSKTSTANLTLVTASNLSPRAAFSITPAGNHTVQIVVLSEADSLNLWQAAWQGRERVFLTQAGLVLDGDTLRLTSTDPEALTVGVFPPLSMTAVNGGKLDSQTNGVFQQLTPTAPPKWVFTAKIKQLQPAGPPRDIPLGQIRNPVAAAPVDADFTNAAVWQINLPRDLDLSTDPILRLDYVGDVARVTLDGQLITDDFYNGRPLEIGLKRHAPDILKGDLRVSLLPLRPDAPIYLAKGARPDFHDGHAIAELRNVKLVPRHQVRLLGHDPN